MQFNIEDMTSQKDSGGEEDDVLEVPETLIPHGQNASENCSRVSDLGNSLMSSKANEWVPGRTLAKVLPMQDDYRAIGSHPSFPIGSLHGLLELNVVSVITEISKAASNEVL
jgi:hypothetical protein